MALSPLFRQLLRREKSRGLSILHRLTPAPLYIHTPIYYLCLSAACSTKPGFLPLLLALLPFLFALFSLHLALSAGTQFPLPFVSLSGLQLQVRWSVKEKNGLHVERKERWFQKRHTEHKHTHGNAQQHHVGRAYSFSGLCLPCGGNDHMSSCGYSRVGVCIRVHLLKHLSHMCIPQPNVLTTRVCMPFFK